MIIRARYIFSAFVLICFLSAAPAYSGDEWTMKIGVKASDVRSKLVIGQKPDAIDGIDGRYDVPAMPGGDIEAYIELQGHKYWKDVKHTCSTNCRKTWNIVIASPLQGEDIRISWDPQNIPVDRSMIMIDMETGFITDMISARQGYSYKNTGMKRFAVITEPAR